MCDGQGVLKEIGNLSKDAIGKNPADCWRIWREKDKKENKKK